MIDAVAIAQNLKAGYDIARGLQSIEDLYKQATIKVQITELTDRLVRAQQDLYELMQENFRLREENAILQAAEDVHDKLILKGGVYYRNDEPQRVPYCVRCYQADHRLRPMKLARSPSAGVFECTVCGKFAS